MFGPTTEVTQALIGSLDLEGIDPYENWEKTTRPSGASAEPLWQPVYVEILADAVPTKPSFYVLFREYNKYWLRGAAALAGV